ncbi:MAG: glycine cleavage system aminomethyltransferase GcvT [Gammaproteobacteria bacterium]|nr:glycine cleavage system aminomethyltransferase GcvT [Gammaproteobacteria bacterium]
MNARTPLYALHEAHGGKIVDFAGWDMPIHYGSQVQEHHQVRSDAGMFDVSHMVVVDLEGEQVIAFLRHLLANDVARLKTSGKALYSCMLNEAGGVIDDLIVYYMNDCWFRMVVNAGTREKDLAWINTQAAAFGVSVTERDELAMIAVQGPNARDRALSVMPPTVATASAELKRFFATDCEGWFVARTGYTGEDGFEVVLPAEQAAEFWSALANAGVKPIGLGARDTLRLEAGMNLYGNDMDESTTPLVAGLGWTVVLDDERDFIGKTVLVSQKADGVPSKLVGLKLTGRGVLRSHQKVKLADGGEGETTSGTFSPTLGYAIAMARVPANVGATCEVEIRGKWVAAEVVKYPFVRDGKACN